MSGVPKCDECGKFINRRSFYKSVHVGDLPTDDGNYWLYTCKKCLSEWEINRIIEIEKFRMKVLGEY